MAERRTSHAVYDTSYHFVCCPKYRKKIFERDEVRQRAEQLIREISQDYNFEVIEMEIAIEHVHILLFFSPSRSIGEVVRIIKSKSARALFLRVSIFEEEALECRDMGRRVLCTDNRRPYDLIRNREAHKKL